MFRSDHAIGTIYAFNKYFPPTDYTNVKEIGKGSFGIVSQAEYVGNDSDFKNQCKVYMDQEGNPHYWFIIKEGEENSKFIEEQKNCDQIQSAQRKKNANANNSCHFNLCVGGFIKTKDGPSPIILGQLEGQRLELVENEYVPHSVNSVNFFKKKIEHPIYAAVSDDALFTFYESLHAFHQIDWLHGDVALRNAQVSEEGGKIFLKLIDYGHALPMNDSGCANEGRRLRPVKILNAKRAAANTMSKNSDWYGYRVARLEELATSVGLENYELIYIKAKTCQILLMNESPETTTVPLKSDAAYIRYEDKIYYATKDSVNELPDISQQDLYQFDTAFCLNSYSAYTNVDLSLQDLYQIEAITGHFHLLESQDDYVYRAFKIDDKRRMEIFIKNTQNFLESLPYNHPLKKIQQRKLACYKHYLANPDLDPNADFIAFIKARENFILHSLKADLVPFNPNDAIEVQAIEAHLNFFDRLENRLKHLGNVEEPFKKELQNTIIEILSKYKQVRYLYETLKDSPSDEEFAIEELADAINMLEEEPLLEGSDFSATWSAPPASENKNDAASVGEQKPNSTPKLAILYDEVDPSLEEDLSKPTVDNTNANAQWNETVVSKNANSETTLASDTQLSTKKGKSPVILYDVVDDADEFIPQPISPPKEELSDSIIENAYHGKEEISGTEIAYYENLITQQINDLEELFAQTRACHSDASHVLRSEKCTERSELEKIKARIDLLLSQLVIASNALRTNEMGWQNAANDNHTQGSDGLRANLTIISRKLGNQIKNLTITKTEVFNLLESINQSYEQDSTSFTRPSN